VAPVPKRLQRKILAMIFGDHPEARGAAIRGIQLFEKGEVPHPLSLVNINPTDDKFNIILIHYKLN
jgi:hypothetical protein